MAALHARFARSFIREGALRAAEAMFTIGPRYLDRGRYHTSKS